MCAIRAVPLNVEVQTEIRIQLFRCVDADLCRQKLVLRHDLDVLEREIAARGIGVTFDDDRVCACAFWWKTYVVLLKSARMRILG